MFVDTLPWGGLEASMIKELLEGGHGLAADTQVPQPYYEVVRSGLQLRPQERTGSLQDIRYLLRKDMQVQRSHETAGTSFTVFDFVLVSTKKWKIPLTCICCVGVVAATIIGKQKDLMTSQGA